MSVEIIKVVHGTKRWVRSLCPDCTRLLLISTKVGMSNTGEVQCSDCGAMVTVNWDESDEQLQ